MKYYYYIYYNYFLIISFLCIFLYFFDIRKQRIKKNLINYDIILRYILDINIISYNKIKTIVKKSI